MQIADIKPYVVANPPPHFGGLYWIFVVLTTDGGVKGVGEVYSVPFHPDVVTQMILDVGERYVLGADPFDIESLWRRIYSRGFTQRPDTSILGILSAIEMACWDIVGKETGKPVHKLLGGQVHERLRAYTYIYPEPGDSVNVYTDAELSAQRAAAYVAQGFTAVKFDPIGPYSAFDPRQPSLADLDRGERFVRLIREAVGDRADLLVGTHGQMTPSAAIRLARRLEPFDPLWLEEPVPPEMPEQMAKVARATSIPIATGERLTTKYEFARLLQTGAASILQMNLGRVGGILEAKKIAGMAEAHYAQIAPHLYCGPVVAAANVQLGLCSPNFLIQEVIGPPSSLPILVRPLIVEDGHVLPPTEPGLGVELDESVAAQHPYTGDALHLEMTQHPIAWK